MEALWKYEMELLKGEHGEEVEMGNGENIEKAFIN